jgi:putative transposase
MPKFARLVIPDCPHHIIQRGNRRQKVFFKETDKEFYLHLMKRHGDRAGIYFLAYCLMNNHVHLIAIPKSKESFARGIGEAHRTYTTTINIREEWKGYLWQGRFLSFPLDERHLYAAIRYVEKNPVRAGLVSRAEDYPWSSARAHIFKTKDLLLSGRENCLKIPNWRTYLGENDDPAFVVLIELHKKTGRPLGDEDFLKKLEILTGRKILPQLRDRKKIIREIGIVSPLYDRPDDSHKGQTKDNGSGNLPRLPCRKAARFFGRFKPERHGHN